MSDQGFPKILAVAAVITAPDGEVLLHVREKEPNQGNWEIIAGYARPGERLEEALRRKIAEETGITEISSIEFTGRYYDDPERHPGKPCIPLLFHVKVPNKTIPPTHTANNLSWHSPDAARKLSFAMDNKTMLEHARII